MPSKFVYRNPRPLLAIELVGAQNLGNCYNGTTMTITSLKPLTEDDIMVLRKAHVLGYGQEFYIRGQEILQEDGSAKLVQPISMSMGARNGFVESGHDMIECVEINDLGEEVPGPAINPYTKQAYTPVRQSYYRYVVEDRVDSSD